MDPNNDIFCIFHVGICICVGTFFTYIVLSILYDLVKSSKNKTKLKKTEKT